MAEPDQLLDVLQADIVALLKSTPALADAFIFTGSEKDLATRLNKTFGTRTPSTGGKRGLGIQVLPIFTDEAEANLPGPPLILRCQILVIENVILNRAAATGTLKTSSQTALNILNALHHHVIGAHAIYADQKPIVPEKMEDGFEGHVVTVTARSNGLTGPGKPAQVMAEMGAGGGGSGIVISGTGIAEVDIELLPAGLENGKNSWTDDGAPFQGNDTVTAVIFSPGIPSFSVDSWQVLRIASNSYEFSASCDSSADSPVGLDFTVSAIGQQGGQPIITGGGGSALTLTCGTAGAAIYYTTDGSYPSPTTGTLYTVPIAGLEAGTVVRAAAYKTGLNPGDCTDIDITD